MSNSVLMDKDENILNPIIPRYEKMISNVLYENENGTNSSITLSDDISNYKYIEIFYRSNDRDLKSTRAFNNSSSSIYVDLTVNHMVTNDMLYIKTTIVRIVNKTLTVTGYGQLNFNTTGIGHTNTNNIFITKILGYKKV